MVLKFVRIPDYRTLLIGTAPRPPHKTKFGWLIRVDVCPLTNWRSPVCKSSTVQNITRLYVLLCTYDSIFLPVGERYWHYCGTVSLQLIG